MGLLQRRLQKKTEAISDRRWSKVARYVATGEHRVEQTAAFYLLPEGRLGCYLLLTTGGLIVSVVQGPGSEAKPFAFRIPLTEVVSLDATDEGTFLRITSQGQKGLQASEFSLIPTPFSARLVEELIGRWRAI